MERYYIEILHSSLGILLNPRSNRPNRNNRLTSLCSHSFVITLNYCKNVYVAICHGLLSSSTLIARFYWQRSLSGLKTSRPFLCLQTSEDRIRQTDQREGPPVLFSQHERDRIAVGIQRYCEAHRSRMHLLRDHQTRRHIAVSLLRVYRISSFG